MLRDSAWRFTMMVGLFSAGLIGLRGDSVSAEMPAAGKQVETELQVGEQKIPFLMHLPADYDSSTDKQWPLMLFLHGRGESYGPLSLVAKWGPPQLAAKDPAFPYILASPQCPEADSWNRETQQTLLVKLLDHLENSYRVDKNRVYLTGLSMGGYGSWTLAASHPTRFAAVVPICGGGDPAKASQLASLPIWVFHGDQDQAVPISKSDEMVKAIRAGGGTKIRYTTLEHIGHNSWEAAYHTPELYEWFNGHAASRR